MHILRHGLVRTAGLRLALTAALCAAALISAPLTAAQTQEPDQTQAMTASADIVLFAYTPATLDIAPGTTVTWLNHDSIIHSVTSGSPDAPGDLFDSGLFDQDQTFSYTFDEPGDFPYFCTRHTFMQGTVHVQP